MLDRGEVVETLLDEKADDSVRVEDEVAAVGALVTDDAVVFKTEGQCLSACLLFWAEREVVAQRGGGPPRPGKLRRT